MKIGQKIVCVDDGPCEYCGTKVPLLIYGKVYVIERLAVQAGLLFLTLTGNPLICKCNPTHTAVRADRFRPLEQVQAENKLKALQGKEIAL